MEAAARVPMRNGMIRVIAFFRDLFEEIWEDDLMGLAAQCAYAFVFAMFPFLIFLVSLAAFLPADPTGPQLPAELSAQIPESVRQILERRIDEVASGNRAGTLTIALLVAIWSATAGATTLVTAINRAYDVTERRGFVRRRLVGFSLIAAGAVLLLLPAVWGWFGGVVRSLLERIGMEEQAVLVDWLRWPVILVGAFAWLTLLFRVAPEGQTRWRLVTPGAIVSALGFLGANRALSFYVEKAIDMSVTYGALGGFVSLLLWLYVCSFVLLLGAEVNAVLDSKKTMRLQPPRPREVAPDHLPPLGKPIRP